MIRWWAAIAALWLAPVGFAAAEQDDAADDTIVVEAQRLKDAARAFVGDLSVQVGGGEQQVARWARSVCPGIVGLRRGQAEAVADRIAARALAVGLDVGEPGCRANMLVLFTPDSDTLAREIVERHGAMLGRYSGGWVATRGRAALRDFAETPRAVRWWHVSRTATVDGGDINRGDMPVTDFTLGGSGVVSLPGGGASRLRVPVRQDFAYAIVIVDAQRVAQTPVGALADYVAMAGLAQLDPDVDTTAYPTILNLFANQTPEQRPPELTDWDIAYLAALYGAGRSLSAARQAGDIADRMGEGLEPTH